MARGGRRSGKPGQAYPNRTDLNAGPSAQPVQAAAGQPYGERGAQEAAQRAQPLPQASPSGMIALPGELGPLNAPTSRPNEPLTAGLPIGPGAGPAPMPPPPAPDALAKGAATLNEFAASANASPGMRELAEIANAMLMNRAAGG